MERASDQIEEYVESQRNVFLVEASVPLPNNDEPSDAASASGDFDDFSQDSDFPENERGFDDASDGETADFDALDAPDEATSFDDDAFSSARRDDVDDFFDRADDVFFSQKPFYRYDRSNSAQEEFAFDPTARSSTTLRERLLEQLRLDGRCADLSPLVEELCEKIVDRLDADGYLKVDALETPLTENNYSTLQTEFESIFNVDATPETLDAARAALAELDAAATKSARDAARRRFDAAVGRKTTADERKNFQSALDSIIATSNENNDANNATLDPLDALFPKKPSKKERDAAEKALAVVQSLDPPGVGARSLQESLLLRVRDDVSNADALRQIIADAFDDFQKKRVAAIAEKTGIPFATVAAIYDAGFPFHPAPSSLFANESPTRLIRPEILLEKSPSGRWRARLDDDRPEFRVDPIYRKMLLAKNVDKATKEYLRRQYVDATALLDALQSRDSTVLRVAQAAVDFQSDYFDDATAPARPLTLRQVADKIGLDPSTVSRACVDKWLATPRGFVALKSLFPKAVSGDVASASVESRIRELIDGEEKSNPLGDEALADELRRRFQIAVSRKTVQEYRERLQIPNSRARKRLFQEQERKPGKRRSGDL